MMSVWCSLSVLHTVLLLLHPQYRYLSFNKKTVFLSLLSKSYHSHSRFSDVSVVFTRSIPLNALAPSSPILFTVIQSSCIVSFFIFRFSYTPKIQRCKCCVHSKHSTYRFCSFVSNLIPCYSFIMYCFLFHFPFFIYS